MKVASRGKSSLSSTMLILTCPPSLLESDHSPTFVNVQPGAPMLNRGSSVWELGLWEGAGRFWTLRKMWP